MPKLKCITIGNEETIKFGIEIPEGSNTFKALSRVLFFQGLLSFASLFPEKKQKITFNPKTSPDYTFGEDLIVPDDFRTYLNHKNGNKVLEYASFRMLIIALKFNDEEIFAMKYDEEDCDIKENFRELIAHVPGFAGNYIEKICIGTYNQKLVSLLHDSNGSWLWEQCDFDSRKGILGVIGYSTKGISARARSSVAEILSLLDKPKPIDKNALLIQIIHNDPCYFMLKRYLRINNVLPSKNLAITYSWDTRIQREHSMARQQEKYARNKLKQQLHKLRLSKLSNRAKQTTTQYMRVDFIKSIC
jgi:hypothetical protein